MSLRWIIFGWGFSIAICDYDPVMNRKILLSAVYARHHLIQSGWEISCNRGGWRAGINVTLWKNGTAENIHFQSPVVVR
jgi:hypothetical protein